MFWVSKSDCVQKKPKWWSPNFGVSGINIHFFLIIKTFFGIFFNPRAVKKMFRNLTCSNCNQLGHIYNHCPGPFISYGVILVKMCGDVHNEVCPQIKYLMIQRKHSFGFIDFVKGKYSLNNLYHIQNSIDQMSLHEKRLILENRECFQKIWNYLQCGHGNKDFMNAFKKFEHLRNGVFISNQMHTLVTLFECSKTQWTQTEWEFPKGRKMNTETQQDCAFREFIEETGFLESEFQHITNLEPLVETFIGSNLKPYQHVYYVAVCNHPSLLSPSSFSLSNFQISEVSTIEWKTFEECMASIRPYHTEKKEMLTKLHKTLLHYLELEK